MINFYPVGKQIRIQIKYKSGSIDTWLYVYWDCGSDILAQAFSNELTRLYQESVQRALKESYEQGYKDGRGKKSKRDWHSAFIKHINS